MRLPVWNKITRWKGFASIQAWSVGVLGAFLLLVLISVCLTFWGLDRQKQDAQVINLAGRQRMLLQQMRGLALEYQQEGQAHSAEDLARTAEAFEQSLVALRYGGPVTNWAGETFRLAAPDDLRIIAELDQLQTAWNSLRPQIDRLTSADSVTPSTKQGAARAIAVDAPRLVEQADRLAHSYENLSAVKIQRLRNIQLGFLVSGLVLLCLVSYGSRAWVIQPLDRLDAFARRIGAGQFDAPIEISGPAEIRILGSTLDTMRSQLVESRGELKDSIGTLETRVRQRTRELEALASVSQEIISHLSLEEVLISVTEKAQQLLGSEVALLCLVDGQGRTLNLQAAAGAKSAVLKTSSSIDERASGRVLKGKNAIPCSVNACPGFCQILSPAYRASHLAAPLRTREHVIGALCVGGGQPNMFRPEAPQLLAQLASIAAVALENSRLFGQAEHAAALEERQRIASEMHDGLLQTLSFLRWMVRMSGEQLSEGDIRKASDTFQKIERAEEQAEMEIRRAIASLQEDFPIHSTLQEQLAALVEDRLENGSCASWQNSVNEPVILSRTESEQVLRVVREALVNAYKHSRAGQVCVRFEKTPAEYQVSVIDDGVGFHMAAAPAPADGDGRAHFGLKIMHARAARIHGLVDIDSAPGQGTRVILRWPISERLAPPQPREETA